MKYLQTLAIESALIYTAIFGLFYFVTAVISFMAWQWLGVMPDAFTLRSIAVCAVILGILSNGEIYEKLRGILGK